MAPFDNCRVSCSIPSLLSGFDGLRGSGQFWETVCLTRKPPELGIVNKCS